ncbi:MAG: adenylyltransferase/cytidyltransferase family protein, partial [Candidatus Gracilibacteria bacterium]|nr:adenylyltransferase/cytidyltransferase family protein [Candidatus Gracilibacteria bacterium]
MTKKLGLFIGRMNPPHKGHIAVIEKALSENDQVLILLGSNGDVDENNPLTFEQRKNLLMQYFLPSFRFNGRCPKDGGGNENNSKIQIDIIKDTKTDVEWVQNISNIIKEYGKIKLNIYGGDFEKDSAIIAIKQHEGLLGDNVKYISID